MVVWRVCGYGASDESLLFEIRECPFARQLGPVLAELGFFEIQRPDGTSSRFAYDSMGRVAEVKHSDGGLDRYAYDDRVH